MKEGSQIAFFFFFFFFLSFLFLANDGVQSSSRHDYSLGKSLLLRFYPFGFEIDKDLAFKNLKIYMI